MTETNILQLDEIVPVPESFPFPYKPYGIQESFMKALFSAINHRKIGIFESPTGTGKSLSLICGALTWLTTFEDHRKVCLREMEEKVKKKIAEEDVDWFNSFNDRRKDQKVLAEVKIHTEWYAKREEKFMQMKLRKQKKVVKRFKKTNDDPSKIRPGLSESYNASDDDENDIVLKDYQSDEARSDEEEESCVGELKPTQIIYCSRTHSQLSQFVHEVKKSPYCSKIRCVTLASRKNMCTNDDVAKLKIANLINDVCLSLQNVSCESEKCKKKEKKKSTKKCPYFKPEAADEMRVELLNEIHDIEESVTVGKDIRGCPYYGSRKAAVDAELLVVPYNILLHEKTREACRLSLKDNVIIIDEGHNLLEAVSSMYKTEATGLEIKNSLDQVTAYRNKYNKRLHPRNMMFLHQLKFVLDCLLKQLEASFAVKPSVFLSKAGLENTNMFKLLTFCKACELGRKLRGFAEKHNYTSSESMTAQKPKSCVSEFLQNISIHKDTTADLSTSIPEANPNSVRQSVTPFMNVEAFLESLCFSADSDGSIIAIKRDTLESSSLRYLLLNPAMKCKEIINDARAVIIAGGTMEPVSEFSELLVKAVGADPKRIEYFSCGHVIPPDNLLPINLTHGPTGHRLEFTYNNRGTDETLDELGRILCNMCNVIPGGVVCFFPSYDYMYQVKKRWDATNVCTRISSKKLILQEPKSSADTDSVLYRFTSAIEGSRQGTQPNKTGALLLCVVGGKLSEGINFSDDLGRCVIMVGLPFPNKTSLELIEKMNYLNSTMHRSGNQSPGQIFYQNTCMKAVNQSIGRAIRHRNDYAVILLVDCRYGQPNIRNSLPGWIASRLGPPQKFPNGFATVNQFFRKKKK